MKAKTTSSNRRLPKPGAAFPPMKSLTTCLLAALFVFLSIGSDSFAGTTTKRYAAGIYNGQECSVDVNWHNWSGLGPVDGHINLRDGTTIPFSGNNSRKGVLEIEAAGEGMTLVKEGSGSSASWISGTLAFSEGGGGTRPSTGSRPPVEKSPGTKSYAGNWRGRDCTARITWKPGDDADTLWRGEGTLIVEGDMALSITGWQPRADYIEFGIDPDPSSEVYKATKERRGGRTTWAGRFLTLTETSGAGGSSSRPGNRPPPPRSNPSADSDAVWVIACEANSSRQAAEDAAAEWTNRGFLSGSVWIPDYSSLSGAKMHLTYVGWYDYNSEKDEARAELGRVKRYYPKAYGIKLDHSGRREQF